MHQDTPVRTLLAPDFASIYPVCAETIQIAGITMTTPSHNHPMPDLSNIKGVLFDVDGTLTDSDPLHFKAFQDILTQYNYKVCP